jgi:Tfp pilus assembly protein PilX
MACRAFVKGSTGMDNRGWGSLANEQGSVMVIALIILALVTVLGISSTTTTSIELQIAANDKFNKISFFSAESGWQRAVNWLDRQYPMLTENAGSDMSGAEMTFSSGKYANPDNVSLNTANSASYRSQVQFTGAKNAAGYSSDFKRYTYAVSSAGDGPNNALSQVNITAGKVTYVGGY